MKGNKSKSANEDEIFTISTEPSSNEEPVKSDPKGDSDPEDEPLGFTNSKERNLEKFLFGKSSATSSQKRAKKEKDEDDLEDDEDEEQTLTKKRKPAWEDEDDEKTKVKDVVATYKKAKGKHGLKETSNENYSEFLRKKFTSLVDTPKWADLDRNKDEGDDSDDEFFRETTGMLEAGRKESLRKGVLEFRKLKDVNFETHNEGAVIRSCEFHPKATVGLVAGLNGAASLFQVDGKTNPKMQTVCFENFPVQTAHFTNDGQKFVVGSRHFGHFFAYDMYAGKVLKVPWKEDREQTNMQKFEMSPANDLMAFHGRFGVINILSSKSFTKIFSLKMNHNVRSVAFSSDGEKLYSHGDGGEVYIWDLKAQDCIHKFCDDGCLKGTAITISRNNDYVATGSDSGVVNIYKNSSVVNSVRPKPEKIVYNLTTAISKVKFNPTSEVVAMTSEVHDNAVRLLHLPSMTVFKNFPGNTVNLRRINCLDFSPNGGYMAIGNNKGAANLFRLRHYGNY